MGGGTVLFRLQGTISRTVVGCFVVKQGVNGVNLLPLTSTFTLQQLVSARLRENTPLNCTACPAEYVPDPTEDRPRRCVLPGTQLNMDGVHCGEDTGLGSVWEANLRMPALARWPGQIASGVESMALVSTLDVVPTILSVIGGYDPAANDLLDGVDMSPVLLGLEPTSDDRVLFFWRDGFHDGPLGPPYGRFDVAAVKFGRIKVWFWTKSAHYNADPEVYHDPPLLFDTLADPAEGHPLDHTKEDLIELIKRVKKLVQAHKKSIDWTYPLALARDPRYIPCVNEATGCRTIDDTAIEDA
jgi:C-terminal region of aryl-sulfatase